MRSTNPVTLTIPAGFSARRAPAYGQWLNRAADAPPILLAMPAPLVPPVTHTRPAKQGDGGGQFDPTSPNLTPRPNPHRTRGIAAALLPRDFVPWRFSDAGL
jgi:hypothetical protein